MKKAILMIIFVSVLILQLSPVTAWAESTHYEIIEKTYHALPSDVQSKLSLNLMKKGAGDPDLIFHDFQNHQYPANIAKANYWLNKGKLDYEKGNYNDSSYSFGVASHYISDGCCAPHCECGSSHYYHFIYELDAVFLSPQLKNSDHKSEDTNSLLDNDGEFGKLSWEMWVKTKNDTYIQTDLNRAVNACYASISERVN